ncbi:hypothetical protein [Fibrobacter sp.]|uniref:hypothetical protein n=1 Tax=Fibrobacter sp. TaxID=35828 RepID=UPI0038908AB5
MEVNYELLQRGCLKAHENRLKQERIREATPERKAQHRRYAQSEAGKRSDLERHRRYRATENGRMKTRAKSRRYWLKVKDDPEWRAHKLEVQTMWRHMKKAMRLNGEHTLWLMGGMVKVNMVRAA